MISHDYFSGPLPRCFGGETEAGEEKAFRGRKRSKLRRGESGVGDTGGLWYGMGLFLALMERKIVSVFFRGLKQRRIGNKNKKGPLLTKTTKNKAKFPRN